MYSTSQDLIDIIPRASGSLIPTASFESTYASLAAKAASEIDAYLEGYTAVPIVEATGVWLNEVEALLVTGRLMAARYSAVEQEGSGEFRRNFKKEAYTILDDHSFPATADVPTQLDGFVGNGTIEVTVHDHLTSTALWVVRCEVAGTSSSSFSITRKTPESEELYTYSLSAEDQFPTTADIQSGSEISKQIKIVITAGVTAFSRGDTWVFKTYANYKKNRPSTIRSFKFNRG